MPGRLSESSLALTSIIETGGLMRISSNRRRNSSSQRRSLDRMSPSSNLQDSLGLVSLFSRYPTLDMGDVEVSPETVESRIIEQETPDTTSSELAPAGLSMSLASSLNLLRRRELRLREMRARVDGMAERLALMRESRSIVRRSLPARSASSSSITSFPVSLSPLTATWPIGVVRRALRGTWLAQDAFLDANGDSWADDKPISDSDEPPDIQQPVSQIDLSSGFEYAAPFMMSSYRIVDGVLFNLDGEQVAPASISNAELRSCKELYDEMAMHNMFLRDYNNDGSLYLYSTIAHNENSQKRRKYSVDLCAGR